MVWPALLPQDLDGLLLSMGKIHSRSRHFAGEVKIICLPNEAQLDSVCVFLFVKITFLFDQITFFSDHNLFYFFFATIRFILQQHTRVHTPAYAHTDLDFAQFRS